MPTVHHQTPLGIVRITEEDGYINCISIRDEELTADSPQSEVLKLAVQQMDEYFAGERKDFDLPIRQEGSDFQQEVWQELMKIEYGRIITYGDQSERMNSPLAIRAIAAA